MKTTPDILKPITENPLDRWPYFWWGFALMFIKYNLDRAIAVWGFHRTWYFWNYIKPHGFAAIDAVPPEDETFYYILLLTSFPFLVAGLILTVRRLYSAGLSLGLCLLFFVPVINLIFFLVLCAIPAETLVPSLPQRKGWTAWLPEALSVALLWARSLPGWLESRWPMSPPR